MIKKNIAIIPARGGSKRIPRKNIKNFLGKPIIAYPIEILLKSNLFDEVIVSTDDEEIAEIAIKYGASVPFLRSKTNSDDFATTADVLLEVIQKLEENNKFFENAICVYPCSPFLSQQLLTDSFEKLTNLNLDCVFPIVKYGHPIQRALKIDNNIVSPYFEENNNTRTQDLTEAFHDAGMFYLFNTNVFKETRSLRTKNTFGIEIDECLTQDIDNLTDWKLAELKYKMFFLNEEL